MKLVKLYMAPMKGFTDHMFRTVFSDHFKGFDLAVAPFIATPSGRRINRKILRDVLPDNNTRLPVVPQLLGKSPEDFILLANILHDMGYNTVNWNLGCPYPMVAKKKRGAGMLPHTDRIQAFLDRVIPGIRGAISIKLRLGWKDNSDIYRLLPVINDYPLAGIIIHPRTGVQRYDGDIDLDTFADCLDRIRHPVVYNGDIRTVEDYEQLSERFGDVQAWMIGRGCLINPFLPDRIKTGTDAVPDKIQQIKQFHEALFDVYSRVLDGPSHVLNKMKGLWRYMSLPFADFRKTMKAIKKTRRPDQYLDRVNLFFETEAEWCESKLSLSGF